MLRLHWFVSSKLSNTNTDPLIKTVTKNSTQWNNSILHGQQWNRSYVRLMRDPHETSFSKFLLIKGHPFQVYLINAQGSQFTCHDGGTSSTYTIVICPLKAAFHCKCSVPYRHNRLLQPLLRGQKYQPKDDKIEYFIALYTLNFHRMFHRQLEPLHASFITVTLSIKLNNHL